MSLNLVTAPTIEPVTLADVKEHLRIDSSSFADDVSENQTIVPDNHSVAASFSLEGAGVDVLNYSVVVILNAGTCGSGGTVDVKLQESDNGSLYTDVDSGAFTQVTEANDNAIQEKAYTGTKQYLRAVATVANAACDFAVTIVKDAPTSAEDSYLTGLITVSRRHCEKLIGRSFITQTWELVLDAWPDSPFDILLPPLQSVSNIKYYDTDETEATWSSGDYQVDTKSNPGRVSLGYGKSFPSTTLRPINGVIATFVAGYGDAASDVPAEYKEAIKLLVGHLYEHREETAEKALRRIPLGIEALLDIDRVVRFC